MDCDESQFSSPIVETDSMFDEFECLIDAWVDGDLIEDAITGILSTEPAIEGPPGNVHDQGLEAMAPPESEAYLQDLSNWLLSDTESWTPGLFPSAQNPGNVLETNVDLVKPEPYHLHTLNNHATYSAPRLNIDRAYEGKPNEVWSETGHIFQTVHVAREVEGDRHEQKDSYSFPTCIICLAHTASDRVLTPCGHFFCRSCHSRWLQVEAKPCPQCGTLLSTDAGVITSSANPESNVESRTDPEFGYAPESMICQRGCQPGLARPRSCDTVQHGTEGLDHTAKEFQPVHLEVWQPKSGNQSDPFRCLFPNEAVAESRPSVDAIEAEQQASRKRGIEKTFIVHHCGVAMRFDGVEERFTAYYRPSYWTEDDSAVFLGEYPTFEDAKDAHNLVTLVHEGPHAQMDLTPFTADKYAEELKRWEGKPHADLVCELRLRGRGFLKDGSINYKHVGRRRSTRKRGMTCMRYFSTVLNDPGQSSTARMGKPNRAFLQTFDTPEEAARYADQVLVKQKGVDAWTNFPLSSYITSGDALPLTFLPLSNNFRENLAYKRARHF